MGGGAAAPADGARPMDRHCRAGAGRRRSRLGRPFPLRASATSTSSARGWGSPSSSAWPVRDRRFDAAVPACNGSDMAAASRSGASCRAWLTKHRLRIECVLLSGQHATDGDCPPPSCEVDDGSGGAETQGRIPARRSWVRRAHVKAELAKMDPRQTKAADRSRRDQCPDISPDKAQARAEIWLANERCALRAA